MKTKFDVTGMTCAACQAHVEKSVRKLPGVSQVNVNLLQNNMTIRPWGLKPSSTQWRQGATAHRCPGQKGLPAKRAQWTRQKKRPGR